MSTLRRQFGRNLRRLRLLHDWTQKEMAEQLQMSVNFLSYIERGLRAPSFENLDRIAEVRDLSVANLFEATPADRKAQRVRRATHGTKKSTE